MQLFVPVRPRTTGASAGTTGVQEVVEEALANADRYYRTMSTPGGPPPEEAAKAFKEVAVDWTWKIDGGCQVPPPPPPKYAGQHTVACGDQIFTVNAGRYHGTMSNSKCQ